MVEGDSSTGERVTPRSEAGDWLVTAATSGAPAPAPKVEVVVEVAVAVAVVPLGDSPGS